MPLSDFRQTDGPQPDRLETCPSRRSDVALSKEAISAPLDDDARYWRSEAATRVSTAGSSPP